MQLNKQIAILIVQWCLCNICFAQGNKVTPLKKNLLALKDSARIDCLNDISHEFIQTENEDSAAYFADLALSEAKKSNYVHGVALSLSLKSQIAKHFDDDFKESESLGKESLNWYEKTSNKEGLDNLYDYLIYTVFSQSKFDEAIYYTKKRTELAEQTGDSTKILEGSSWMYAIYRQSGDYEKSFLVAKQKYDLAVKTKDKIALSDALYCMAQLYELIEDYPNALIYFRKVLRMDDDEIRRERITSDNDIWFKMEFTEVFSHLKQFDSAWHYYNLFRPSNDRAVYMRVWWISTGECYYLQKDYRHALENLQLGLAAHKKLNDRNEIMRALLDLGKVYLVTTNNREALKYGREGLNLALATKAKQYIRDGYQILSEVYDRLHQKDSANFYFRKYTTVKDQVLNDQAKAKFAAYNYEQQIALINKEKQIGLQQLEIKRQQFTQASQQKKILIAGIIIVLLVGALIVRSIILKRRNEKQQLKHEIEIEKLEYERTKTELQKQAAGLELQALRAQMNPHFIFNSLSSINMFILENNKLQASEYLSKFSKLMRLILQNSQEAFIPLERELDALQLYLELESLRFEKKFEYNVTVEDKVDTTVLRVPPLIIQPYVENAIWHGLMHKKEKGHLKIELYQQEDALICKITDDGVGRAGAEQLKSKSPAKHKSMGIRITESRIAMTQPKGSAKSVEIRDLVYPDGSAAGTEVILKIPTNSAVT